MDRETLYDAIRELDFDYRMGKVEEDDYRATRSRYENRAVELMRAIEETAGPAPGIEDRIEHEIAALRKKDTGACAGCGSSTPGGRPLLSSMRKSPNSPLKKSIRAAAGSYGRITALRFLPESPDSSRSRALSSAIIARPRLQSNFINGLLTEPRL